MSKAVYQRTPDEIAAQLWCEERHSHKEMDCDFAKSISAAITDERAVACWYADELAAAQSQLSQALRELGEARATADRWLISAIGALAKIGVPTPVKARDEFGPKMLSSEIAMLGYKLDAALRSTAELRGALEPFKVCADTFDESTPDSFPLFSFNEDNEMEELEIELGDLRKARTALASSPPSGTDKDGLRKALGDTVIIDPEIRDGRPVLPGTGFMIADLLAEISDSAGVAEVADGFDLDAKRISNFLDALSGAINDALASSSTKE